MRRKFNPLSYIKKLADGGHGRRYLFASDKDRGNRDLLQGIATDFDQHPKFVQGKLAATAVQLALGPAGTGAPFHHHRGALNSLFVGKSKFPRQASTPELGCFIIWQWLSVTECTSTV